MRYLVTYFLIALFGGGKESTENSFDKHPLLSAPRLGGNVSDVSLVVVPITNFRALLIYKCGDWGGEVAHQTSPGEIYCHAHVSIVHQLVCPEEELRDHSLGAACLLSSFCPSHLSANQHFYWARPRMSSATQIKSLGQSPVLIMYPKGTLLLLLLSH